MVRLNGLHGLRCALHARYDLHHISGPNWTETFAVLQSSWGSVGLMKAHKSLLQEALEDPFNQQFQLVGDNTVPIRHPSFVYSQLIGHPASRIEANMQVVRMLCKQK